MTCSARPDLDAMQIKQRLDEIYSIKCITSLTDVAQQELLNERNKYDVRKWMDDDTTITTKQHNEFLERLRLSSKDRYLVVMRHDNIAGVYSIRNIHQQTAVGGFWVTESTRSSSLALSVVYYAISHVFSRCNIRVISGHQLSTNKGAKKLNSLLGFSVCAEFCSEDRPYQRLELGIRKWREEVSYSAQVLKLIEVAEKVNENKCF